MKNNYVLVKEIIEEEKVSQGGIILTTPEKYNRKARVIRSGVDYIKEGDTIIKTIGKGTMFNINGDDYEILNENHILAILEENGTET